MVSKRPFTDQLDERAVILRPAKEAIEGNLIAAPPSEGGKPKKATNKKGGDEWSPPGE